MTSRDETNFAELMAILGEAFDKIPSPAKIEIFFRALSDLTIDQISQAVSSLLKTRTITGTFPTVAEIIKASGQDNDPDELALLAWAKVSWAIDAAGWGASVAFDDRRIMEALIIWAGSRGYPALQDLDWTHDQVVWRQKEFCAAYKSALKGSASAPPYFVGSYEGHNQQHGFLDHIPKVRLISGRPGSFKQTEVAQALLTGPQDAQGRVIGLIDGVVEILSREPSEPDDLPF
jgi:hypothetical protein